MTELNQAHKEMDVIYHSYAKACGLSDSAFWMLYCVAEHGEGYTQAELCSDWSFSPKTINSALKGLQRRGVVELLEVAGNRKNKQIAFTPAGRELYRQSIEPVQRAESEAFASFAPQEREQFLILTEKHISHLRAAINEIGVTPSEDGSSE